jgi:excisionase family DNA binding protein
MANAKPYLTKPSEAAEVPALLKTNETAQVLNISRRSVQELVERRELAAIKFGRNVRFDPRDIQAFIDSRRNKAIGWKARTEAAAAVGASR